MKYDFSVDQFIVKTSSRLPSVYGREGTHIRFHGGDIFRDAATGIIWIKNQFSLITGDTEMATMFLKGRYVRNLTHKSKTRKVILECSLLIFSVRTFKEK